MLVHGAAPNEVRVPDLEADQEWSRWRAGTTTLGPIGRVLTTLPVVAFGIGGIFLVRIIPMPAYASYFFLAPYLVIAYLVLRYIWARDRVVTKTGKQKRSG
ncbi:MAG: hypothetical protein WD757_00750 [Actinomycetota bacterium]